MPTLFLADMLYLSFKSGMNQPTLVGACCCTVKRYSWFIQLIDVSKASHMTWPYHLKYSADVPSFICILLVVKPHPRCSVCFLPWLNRCQQQSVVISTMQWVAVLVSLFLSTARAGRPDSDGGRKRERERELRHLGKAMRPDPNHS